LFFFFCLQSPPELRREAYSAFFLDPERGLFAPTESQEAGAKAGQEARGSRWERCGERGPRLCLPSISSPLDEIWLRDRLTVPISSRQFFLELGRKKHTLRPEPLARLLPVMGFSLQPFAHQSKTLNLI
jgi:hypothetical protein